ncbi:MAG: hypothetical protein Kow0042_03650 [Calditrichia bacterium]
MKMSHQIKRLIIPIVLIVVFMLLPGCEKNTPVDSIGGKSNIHFDINTHSKPFDPTGPSIQSASHTYTFSPAQNGYRKGAFSLPNNSEFSVAKNLLVPPPGINWGEDVTITMTCEMRPLQNELIFSFSPSGCQFNPPARVTLHWADLNLLTPTLFYIDENGNYIPQAPDEIDYNGQKMILYIDHFSRYAIGDAP